MVVIPVDVVHIRVVLRCAQLASPRAPTVSLAQARICAATSCVVLFFHPCRLFSFPAVTVNRFKRPFR